MVHVACASSRVHDNENENWELRITRMSKSLIKVLLGTGNNYAGPQILTESY